MYHLFRWETKVQISCTVLSSIGFDRFLSGNTLDWIFEQKAHITLLKYIFSHYNQLKSNSSASDSDIEDMDTWNGPSEIRVSTEQLVPPQQPFWKNIQYPEQADLRGGMLPIGQDFLDLYKDPNFVKRFHKRLDNKITAWQTAVIDILFEARNRGIKDIDKYCKITRWAEYDVGLIKTGILETTQLCVGIMSDELILCGGVAGVDGDREKLNFIRQMVGSRKVTVQIEEFNGSFSLYTIFDDNDLKKIAFGDYNDD
jgi:hypothetical protein